MLEALYAEGGRARIIGVTGAPGSGKSSLIDAVTAELRRRRRTVAIVAVDPSSALTGGALLGDRIRMHRHTLDQGVLVRSMSSRGCPRRPGPGDHRRRRGPGRGGMGVRLRRDGRRGPGRRGHHARGRHHRSGVGTRASETTSRPSRPDSWRSPTSTSSTRRTSLMPAGRPPTAGDAAAGRRPAGRRPGSRRC